MFELKLVLVSQLTLGKHSTFLVRHLLLVNQSVTNLCLLADIMSVRDGETILTGTNCQFF